MNIRKMLMALTVLALLPLQSWAQDKQDKSPKTLQEWMDFLRQDASMDSVIHRIGPADKEKSVEAIAAHAQMFVWFNRFANSTRKDNRLELVAAPEAEPDGFQHMIVVGLLDPQSGRGIYLPWAWRFVDEVPEGNYIPRDVMQALILN